MDAYEFKYKPKYKYGYIYLGFMMILIGLSTLNSVLETSTSIHVIEIGRIETDFWLTKWQAKIWFLLLTIFCFGLSGLAFSSVFQAFFGKDKVLRITEDKIYIPTSFYPLKSKTIDLSKMTKVFVSPSYQWGVRNGTIDIVTDKKTYTIHENCLQNEEAFRRVAQILESKVRYKS